jgi:hypothetical protein
MLGEDPRAKRSDFAAAHLPARDHMPYVTSIERNAMFKVIVEILREKFGEEANDLALAIREINDAEKYLALSRTVSNATTLDQVRRAYRKMIAPPRKRNGKGRRGESAT